MADKMIERLEAMSQRVIDIDNLLCEEETASDVKKLTSLNKERASLIEAVEVYAQYKKDLQDLKDAEIMVNEDDAEIVNFAKESIKELTEKTAQTYDRLKIMLLPKDPNDDKDIVCEIRGAAGGDERPGERHNLHADGRGTSPALSDTSAEARIRAGRPGIRNPRRGKGGDASAAIPLCGMPEAGRRALRHPPAGLLRRAGLQGDKGEEPQHAGLTLFPLYWRNRPRLAPGRLGARVHPEVQEEAVERTGTAPPSRKCHAMAGAPGGRRPRARERPLLSTPAPRNSGTFCVPCPWSPGNRPVTRSMRGTCFAPCRRQAPPGTW